MFVAMGWRAKSQSWIRNFWRSRNPITAQRRQPLVWKRTLAHWSHSVPTYNMSALKPNTEGADKPRSKLPSVILDLRSSKQIADGTNLNSSSRRPPKSFRNICPLPVPFCCCDPMKVRAKKSSFDASWILLAVLTERSDVSHQEWLRGVNGLCVEVCSRVADGRWTWESAGLERENRWKHWPCLSLWARWANHRRLCLSILSFGCDFSLRLFRIFCSKFFLRAVLALSRSFTDRVKHWINVLELSRWLAESFRRQANKVKKHSCELLMRLTAVRLTMTAVLDGLLQRLRVGCLLQSIGRS